MEVSNWLPSSCDSNYSGDTKLSEFFLKSSQTVYKRQMIWWFIFYFFKMTQTIKSVKLPLWILYLEKKGYTSVKFFYNIKFKQVRWFQARKFLKSWIVLYFTALRWHTPGSCWACWRLQGGCLLLQDLTAQLPEKHGGTNLEKFSYCLLFTAGNLRVVLNIYILFCVLW